LWIQRLTLLFHPKVIRTREFLRALMLADNGYAPANPVEWIENLSPEIVLLSVSGKDGSGMPSKETLEAVEGYNLLRTDQNGWIELSTDGEQLRVEAER
jgi:beta-lactamase superfamily II metal-dependent hydrolase